MGEMATVLNVGEEFQYGGKTYKVTRRDWTVQAEFERFCARKQLEHIRGQQDVLNPLEYQVLMEGWRRDGGAFAFSWGGPNCSMTLLSEPGQKEMVYLRLKRANPQSPEITREFVETVYDSREVRREEVLADGTKAPVYPWDDLIQVMGRLDNPNRPKPQEGAREGAATPSTSAS